jgi:hypothetical protein
MFWVNFDLKLGRTSKIRWEFGLTKTYISKNIQKIKFSIFFEKKF